MGMMRLPRNDKFVLAITVENKRYKGRREKGTKNGTDIRNPY